MATKEIIKRINKGPGQNKFRFTMPKDWPTDYVRLTPVKIVNVFKTKKRYYDKD